MDQQQFSRKVQGMERKLYRISRTILRAMPIARTLCRKTHAKGVDAAGFRFGERRRV
jgi:hypothetical protein